MDDLQFAILSGFLSLNFLALCWVIRQNRSRNAALLDRLDRMQIQLETSAMIDAANLNELVDTVHTNLDLARGELRRCYLILDRLDNPES